MQRFNPLTLLLAALLILLQACAYVPTTRPDVHSGDGCNMVTKELKLEERKLIRGGTCSSPICAVTAVVPATTFVVSGSIVLIGNTVHWLEKNGTCSDGLLRRNLSAFLDWASGEGGTVVSD